MPRKAQIRWPACQECLGDGIDQDSNGKPIFCPACSGTGEWDSHASD